MSSTNKMFDMSHPTTRNGFVAGLIVIVLVMLGGIYWVMSTNYSVLFKDLSSQDAATLISQLDEMDIAYKLKDGGTTVLVSEDEVHHVRLKLMDTEAKLIGGVGFELFDNSDFGMTEFLQKINYQRALQGELTRTIASLDEIKYARVHLVLPENSLFKQEKSSSRASVTLFVKHDKILTEKQILGIQRLIASAVPGMELSAVAVVNQNGETLSRPSSSEQGAFAVSEHLRMRQEVETYLTSKVNQVLERTFGVNQALVSIDVTLNHDIVKTTLENVIPSYESEKGVVKTRETKSQSGNKNDRVTTEVEYKLGRKVDQIVTAPGSIKSISVGVVLPADATITRIAQVEELVAAAVGLDKSRGDEIVVHAVGMQKQGTTHANMAAFDAPSYKFKKYIEQDELDRAFGNTNGVNGLEDVKTKHTESNLTNGITNDGFDANEYQDGVVVDSDPMHKTGFNTILNKMSLEELRFLLLVKYRELLIIGLVFLGLLILSIAWAKSVNRRDSLSSEEREKVLQQLQQWLESENNKVVEQSRG